METSPDKSLIVDKTNYIDLGKEDPQYKDIGEVCEYMTANEQGSVKSVENGDTFYYSFAKLGYNNWTVAFSIDTKILFSSLNTLNAILISVMTAACIILLAVAYLASRIVAEKMIKLRDYFNEFAKGDFQTEPDKSLNTSNEIGEIYNAVMHSRTSLKEMISKVKNSSEVIGENCNNLNSISKELAAMSENISEVTKISAEDTMSQSETLLKIDKVIKKFSERMKDISNQILEINNVSSGILNKNNENNKDMTQLLKALKSFSSEFQNFSDSMKNMQQQFKSANEFTALINNVTEQTNLLAQVYNIIFNTNIKRM